MMRHLVLAALCVGLSGCTSDKATLKAGFYKQREQVKVEQELCNSRFPEQPGYFRQRSECRLDATEKLRPYLPDDLNEMLVECRDQQLELADEADDGDIQPSDYQKKNEALKDQCIRSMNKDSRISRWQKQSSGQ